MEYKYSTINEVNHFEFGEAVVGDIQLTERMFHLVLDNVKICPENSCNRDIRMMRIRTRKWKKQSMMRWHRFFWREPYMN